MSEEEIFFNDLLSITKKAFYKSPVYNKNKHKDWFYSICSGPFTRKKPIVFGLNWGVGKDFVHKPQVSYPKEIDSNTWPFKTHVDKHLTKHFDCSFDEINYSNLCFFRTPSTKFLSWEDWMISIPLFQAYVEFIDPPYIIMMGSPKYFNSEQFSNRKTIGHKPEGKKRNFYVRTGLLFGKYPFGSVPHSAARCSHCTHDILWEKMYSNLQSKDYN
ncbi:hypothetical protein [Zobellia roscoffensis]|uniref:hypothetical protein n=1 Tax=Zobellia roscoffensis TaxID=2779508 RepID=UPI00188C9D4E|nr:hypothetical protein [Zobellia roscoffensis]